MPKKNNESKYELNNEQYWSNRAEQRMHTYHKDSVDVINKVAKAYDNAIIDINKDIYNIFDNYALKGGLSEAEAVELLNSKISKNDLADIRNKIKLVENEDLKRYLMAIINTNAYKARITRLEALKEMLIINLKKVADVELRESTKLYINTINNAYYKTIYDYQNAMNMGFSFNRIDNRKIEQIIKTNWSGKNYSKRVWHNTDIVAERLEEVLTKGIMSGHSLTKMSKEMQELTDLGKFASDRLIRTETTFVANQAEIQSYEEVGIEEYVYLATLDLRTSEVCRKHDHKKYLVSEAKAGINLPPLHPFCRSTTIAYMDEEWFRNMTRIARNPTTGKNMTIRNMNYEEWYNTYVKK